MEPLVASTSRKLTTHSIARVEPRKFTVVVFPFSTLVNIFLLVGDGAVDGLLLRAKISLHIWSTCCYARLTTKENSGNPLRLTLIYH
jgi:hypothetical protein